MKIATILSTFSFISSAFAYESLKSHANGIKIGVAGNTIKFNNSAYVKAMSNFNYMVAENGCKLSAIQNRKGVYNFSDCDAHLSKAKELGMSFRGHCLIWHAYPPSWFENLRGNDLKQAIIDHITTVLKHYNGKIDAWDVVNEAIDDSSNGSQWKMRPSFLYQNVPDFIDIAFKTARSVSPSTKLFYNDYNTEGIYGKSEAVFNFVKSLKSRNIPIDGVGLQYHVSTRAYPEYSKINNLISRYCALGLEVHITEMDVKVDGNESVQSKVYTEALKACLNNSCCKAFLVWGVGDNDSWLGSSARALLFDSSYQPKAAYNALIQTLGGSGNGGGSNNYQNNNNNNNNNNQNNNNNNNNNQNNNRGGNCAGVWAQCGGIGFNGPTCCSQGTCKKLNDYYSQCQN